MYLKKFKELKLKFLFLHILDNKYLYKVFFNIL